MDKEKKRVTLIDAAVPASVNIDKKHKEKVEKYLLLGQEIKDVTRPSAQKYLARVWFVRAPLAVVSDS